MSVLADLIYGGSNAVAGLTEGAVNDAIAKYGADKTLAFPDTAYFFPTIYAATGVKVTKLGDLPACMTRELTETEIAALESVDFDEKILRNN